MNRKPTSATIIACVALFFSLGGAGLAAAPAGQTYYYVSTTKSGEGNLLARATCHPGDRVVSGGFVTSGSISASSPSHQRSWVVAASAPGSFTLRVTAECQS